MAYRPQGPGSRSPHSTRRSDDLPGNLGKPGTGGRGTGGQEGMERRGEMPLSRMTSRPGNCLSTGEPDAVKVARPVRGGAVGNGLVGKLVTDTPSLSQHRAGRLLYAKCSGQRLGHDEGRQRVL